MAYSGLDAQAAKLVDPSTDINVKLGIIRDFGKTFTSDAQRDPEWQKATTTVCPILIDTLKTGSPVWKKYVNDKENVEQVLRVQILELLHKLLTTEAMRSHLNTFIPLLFDLVRTDNEEIAIHVVKMFHELFRGLRAVMESHIPTFMQLIIDLYTSTGDHLDEVFGPGGAATSEPDRSTLNKSSTSLRVIAELQLVCLFILQTNQTAQAFNPQGLADAALKLYLYETPQEKEKDTDKMDEGELHFGPPSSIANQSIFSDLIVAQVKAGPVLSLVLRKDSPVLSSESWPQLVNQIPAAALRALRVMSPDAYSLRKEGITSLRHLAATDVKVQLATHFTELLDDRMLLGNLKSEPAFFISTHAQFAEITFQLRPFIDLDATLALLRHQCERLSDSNAPHLIASHTGRILIYTLDPLSVKLRAQDNSVPPEVAAKLSNMLHALLETICTRLHASITIGERLYALKDGTASEELKQLVTLEQSRTVPVFPYLASETLETTLNEERIFLRAVPNTVRLALQIIRALNGRVPDSDIMGRLFKYLCSAMTVVKADAQFEATVYKQMAEMFTEMEPHVFQDVWTKHMGMYFDALVMQPNLMSIVQLLYQSPQTMFPLTALVLRHLVDHMETLNEGNAQSTAVMSRMYRITFMSLANLQDGFERMLLPHLTKLLIDVFPMAARAHHSPRNLRMVPYYLFRAFGNKGATAKFELLHQEIYPLLPELLDSVNRALELTDDEVQQDQLVEIALTIPVRLQYLAPFIAQLWRPLVLALRSSNQEIVKQGLRTLEIAVENLPNIDLLDPKARPVARELVLALHKTLKPGNQHAETAQAATRILGKLGGRNRRILSLPPDLEYEETGVPYSIPIEFTTHIASLKIGPACEVAVNALKDSKGSSYHEPAFEFIKTQLYLLLQQGVEGAVMEGLFCKCIEGAIATIHLSNMEPMASELLREVSKALSEQELAKGLGSQVGRRATITTITILFYETMMTVLVRHSNRSDESGRRLIASIIQELHDRGQGGSKERMRGTMNMIVHIVSKFGSMCWNPDWRYKMAGCTGIAVLISDQVNLGTAWPYWKEMEICRSLVMILKDMPQDPPAEEAEVLSTITDLVKFCNAPRPDSMALDEKPLDEDARKDMAPDEIQHYEWLRRPVAQKIDHYIGVFATDLKSPTKAVRDATQDRFKLLADLCGRPLSEIIGSAVEKITADIYSKPLRMFLPQVQVGYMEAITYLLNIEPSVITVSDELLRLMGEVIALGEMEEPVPNPMYPLQRPARRTIVLSAQTKAASIRLVTASLVITDFLSKHPILRQKATSLLFKALYSPNEEIKTAAHNGLSVFLKNQSRLPREHLQAGLRPVLMNLADPAKLTVGSLEGLARLLGLLTNYFKVEIATKLIDHFKALSDDEILNNAAYGPMADNDAISKLVRLLNIFHLLPPAANAYLEQVTELVVTTETKIHAASPTPFTSPISAYLDRFPSDALETLFKHVKDARWVQTYRHIIQAGQAPNFTTALKGQGARLAQSMENAENGHAGVPAILICLDLAQSDPEWMAAQEEILEALKVVWTSQFTSVDEEVSFAPARLVLIRAIYMVWIEVFKVTPRVDILASLPLAFTRPVEICYAEVLDFINFHVTNKTTAAFKHQAVQHLFTMLDEGSPEALVVQYLRVIVIPLLTAEFRQAQNCDVVVADGLIAKITAKAWKASPSSMSSALLSEYLQLTSILIVNALPRLASDTRPVVAKYVWDFLKHPEPIVRNSACLTAARLFSLKEVTSEKFQRPLWLTLLKAPPDGELSPVARQALDIMTPVMPRLASPDVSLRWDQAICRTLVEEQHNLVTTVHIYRLLLRHSDQCYQSKESFVPPIAQGLTRLGFNPGFTGETRTLALDLVDLIINWHRRASEEAGEAMVVDSTSPAASWEIPTHLKENIIGYLIRFAAAATPDTFRAGLNTRALTQLKTLCSLPDWSDLNVRMSYFSRILETPENSDSGAIWNLINCVKALNVVITDRSDAWVLQRAGDLFAFTKRVLVVPQDPVIDSFSSVLDRVFDVLPVGEEGTELTGPAGDLWQWISEFVRESLGNLVRIPGTLAALLSVVKHSPSRIEPFGHGLMKLFHRLIKEHAASLPADQANANVQRIFSVLEISKLSVRCLGDHRKQFLSGLVQLVNTTPNGELRRRLLAMAREWVMTPGITVPTTKEKASLMQKMQSWSKYNDQVYQDYLKLVYEIYSTPSMARTDLTVRLEASFILGCKAEDPALRRDFLDLFDAHIPKQIGPRLAYLLGGQGWDVMIEFNWAYVVLDMILAAVNEEAAMSPAEPALSTLADHVLRVKDILHPLRHIFFYDSLAMSRVFVSLFGEIWHGLPRKEQGDITASIIIALTRQAPQELPRNNVFQTLLAAVQRCNPPIALPPHVVKYLSKTYHSWYEGLEFLQSAVEQGREDDASVREANQDALAELYAELSEDDYYYGLWRRRCLYEETNAALSFEQNGLYQFAQPLYETAQIKARQNIYPMSEAEYYVWEDHWMLCSQKLLQWDILQDVASGEANADLALECAWRTLQTWNHDNVAVQTFINSYQGVLTPRRQLFKAYYTLYSMACTLKEQQALMAQAAAQNQSPASRVGVMATGPESDFARFVDEANQLSLRKWIALPEGLTQAHVKILGQFQQVVELREASLLMSNLTSTTRENLNEKAAEAKGIFHHWRERLPLQHDEIDIWNDVVSWRQHVFHAVNKFYLPLSPDGPGQAASGTHIHRGHHESAWIINRFAHVARRHGLLQVCQNSLADIYKLPNIEISEAFLKLREQARCHLERPNELYQGLEVINNTNLVYFTGPQKSEFFAMKGVFLHKLARHDDANAAFGQAVQLDISMPKAWAKWGVFQDDMHHLTPTDFSLAASAVSCYLQAASLHKNAKCRPLLNRVLWLLSMDDQEGTVAQSWDKYQGEHVYWYWITFIPQLLMSLSQREGRCAHFILHGIAKTFPQALYYPLRAQKDEFQTLKKEHMQRQAVAMTSDPTSDTVMNGVDGNPVASGATIQDGTKHSWDMAEELVALLKTGHPLLALSLEQIAEQIRERLKPNLEEEAYRMTTSLLSDALTHLAPPSREMHAIAPSILLTAQKVASTLPLGEMRTTFEVRLSKPNATMVDIVQAIVSVRDQIESTLDRRPRFQSMEVWSHFLVEFHLNRSEKVSVPGQYLEHKDNNSQFIEIKRISTRLERCRSPIIAFRRLTFMGHDGSAHMFMIQPQSARSSRREERLAQITRIFNERLSQKKEAKKRNLEFNVVPTVFLNAFLRLVKLDSSYVGFMDIYDEHCAHNGFGREEPSLLFQEKLRTYYYAKMDEGARGSDILKIEYWQARLDAKNEVESKLIPKTILSDYMKRTFKDSTSLWLMRKQFTRQISALNFLSYCMHVQVQPRRMLISRQTGAVSIIDCSLVLRPDRPSLQWNDSTPFRLTPNIQTFVSPLGIEGLMTSSMLALSRGLLEPELDIEKQLWLFLRDDFTTWYKQQGKNLQADEKLVFRVNVAEAITAFIKRMYQLSAGPERTRAQAAEGSSQLPTQTVVGAIQTLINLASNPLSQAKNPDQYYPWY